MTGDRKTWLRLNCPCPYSIVKELFFFFFFLSWVNGHPMIKATSPSQQDVAM